MCCRAVAAGFAQDDDVANRRLRKHDVTGKEVP